MFIPGSRDEALIYKEIVAGNKKRTYLVDLIRLIKRESDDWREILNGFLKRDEVFLVLEENNLIGVSIISRKKKIIKNIKF